MKRLKFSAFALLAMFALTMSSCLHIIEEITVKKGGGGTYKFTLDMSEVKGMMEMMKGMAPDSTSAEGGIGGGDNSMGQMGEELTNVAKSLEGTPGLTNVKEIKDTASFIFGYSFDFQDAAALNKALKIVNKEKFDSKTEEFFKIDGKKFERLAVGDFGAELKKQMSEAGGEEGGDEQMDMVKMFFADMSYKQVYTFERDVKKSSNDLSEISADGKTVTIVLKPFDEEQAKKNPSVATEIKLK